MPTKRIGLLALLTFLTYIGMSQCPPGDLMLQNQFQVDYYVDNCWDKDTIYGQLTIGDYNSNISDLTGLSFTKVVLDGILIQRNDSLISIEGLDSIITFKSWLIVKKNPLLTSIAPLLGAKADSTTIKISENPKLINLDGLDSLHTVAGDLVIEKNEHLTNITGLSGVNHITGSLRIQNNHELPNLTGLNQLKSIETGMSIQFNDSLVSISGLASLQSIQQSLAIFSNAQLKSLEGLEHLNSVGGDLYIGSNDSLKDCTAICELLTSENGIGGAIQIGGNPSQCSNNGEILPLCEELVSILFPQITPLQINPNPTSQRLEFQLNNEERLKKAELITLAGKKIPLVVNQDQSLDISKVIPNVYILILQTNQQTYTQKIIVD